MVHRCHQMLTAEKNRGYSSGLDIVGDIEGRINWLEEKVASLEMQIKQKTKKMKNDKHILNCLVAPGIGPVTISTILAEQHDMGKHQETPY